MQGSWSFCRAQQTDIIQELEEVDGESVATSAAIPGELFLARPANALGSGGITWVLQGGGTIDRGLQFYVHARKEFCPPRRKPSEHARRSSL